MSKSFTQFRVDNITTTLPTTLEYGKEVYYKDASGNLTLYVGDENGAGQPSVGGAKPERVVYVYGTADDVAPNFTTVDGATTYAQSITPSATEPVVIRLFTKSDGTPYTMLDDTNFLEWYEWVNDYHIIFVSDYVRLNTYTQIPVTMPNGLQVWYIDPNGVETLWVGHEDGSAWPAVGYKEYVALLTQVGGESPPIATVKLDTLGGTTYTRISEGVYRAINSAFTRQGETTISWRSVDDNSYVLESTGDGFVQFASIFEGTPLEALNYLFSFRVYP
jgi:hypothetical protein